MFGIGWTEFVLIALVLLIFVGPRQLPGVLKKVGGIIAELRTASRELRDQVADEVRDIENTIGSVSSPSTMVRDMAKDLIEDVGSPYDDIRRAEEDARREIDSIKKDVTSDGAGDAESPEKQAPEHEDGYASADSDGTKKENE